MEFWYEDCCEVTGIVELPEKEDSSGQPNEGGCQQEASDDMGNVMEIV